MRTNISQARKLNSTIRSACLISLVALCCSHPARAAFTSSHVVCRPELAESRRQALTDKLRAITGWSDLRFDSDGALRFGGKYGGGSQTARELITEAVSGKNLIVLEDASDRADTVFCRVVEGLWKRDAANKPPVYIVMIDFTEFSHLTGDRAALNAFNVGWGALHEIAHVVHDSADASQPTDVGACETLVNRMRRECDVAERAEYFYTPFPGLERNVFMNSLVRLAFERQTDGGRKKRYWIMWDANLVGGLTAQNQIAFRRQVSK